MALTHPLRGIKYVRVRFNVRKFSNYMHNTSDALLDSPIVFNNYKNEPFYFIYGAFPSNGRLWWVPTQGFHWDKNNNCVTDDWVQLSTQETQFDLYYNTSKEIREFNNPLLSRVFVTPFSAALDIVTFPVQLGVVVYVLFHGMP